MTEGERVHKKYLFKTAREAVMFAFAKRRSVKSYFSKNKRHIPNGICLGGLYYWRYLITVATKALTSQGGACSSQPKLLPLLALPLSPTGRGRARPSRLFAFAKRRSVKFYFSKNKRHIPMGYAFCFWRRRRDLNSRAGITGLHP
mgnify:CR=1 FL=1